MPENGQEQEQEQKKDINPAAKLSGRTGSRLMGMVGGMYSSIMDRVQSGVDDILGSIPLVGGLLSGIFRGAMTLVNYAVGGALALVGLPLSLPGRAFRAAAKALGLTGNRGQSQPEAKKDQPEAEKNQPEAKKDQPEAKQDQPQLRQNQPEVQKNQPEVQQNQPEVQQNQPEVQQNRPGRQFTPEERQSEIDFLTKNATDKDLGVINPLLATGFYSTTEAGKRQILQGATPEGLQQVSAQVRDRLAREHQQSQPADPKREQPANKVDSKLTGKEVEAKEDLKKDKKGPQPQKEEKVGPEKKEETSVPKKEEASVPKREQPKQKAAEPRKNGGEKEENIFKRPATAVYPKNSKMARFAVEAERAEKRVGDIHTAIQQGKEVKINLDSLKRDLFVMNMDHEMRLQRQQNLMKNGMESPGNLEKALALGKTSGFEQQGLIIREAIGNKLKNATPDQLKDMTGGLASRGFREMIKEADKAPLKKKQTEDRTRQREQQKERTNGNRHRSMTNPNRTMPGLHA